MIQRPFGESTHPISRPEQQLNNRLDEVRRRQGRLQQQWWTIALHASQRFFQKVDLPLLAGLLALIFCGLVVLYSATLTENGVGGEFTKQCLWLGAGVICMLTLSQVPPEWLQRWAIPLLAITILLLALVPFIGMTINGSKRWLNLGFANLQPSEMAKITVAIGLAVWFHLRPMPPSLSTIVGAFAIVAVPMALVLIQPDLGTSLLIFAIGMFAVFFAGLPPWVVGSIVAVVLLSIISIIALAQSDILTIDSMRQLLVYDIQLLQEYQFKRIETTFNPEADPKGAGYQIIQSRIAIGSGGLFGKGWLNGDQTHLAFLPYRSTDFIFPVLAEEFGLAGAIPVLALYLFIVYRGLYIAAYAQTIFGRILAAAISLSFFAHVFVNIGMVSGLLPVVGVPLPLMSYGGTSLVTILAGFGILMSIHKHKRHRQDD